MSDSTEIALPDSSNFAVVTASEDFLTEVVQENIGSELNIFDLDRVKVPTGGGNAWKVATLEGFESTPFIDGIIVYFEDIRAYWQTAYEDSPDGPPDCSARSGVGGGMVGQGEPGGNCTECPFSQFGSAHKGEGQACKAGRRLFMLTEDILLPLMVTVPPTSLKAARQYSMRLSSHGVPYYGVMTRLRLDTAKNANGIDYSKIVFESVGKLTDSDLARIKSYRKGITPALGNMAIDSRDYRDTTDAAEAVRE